MVQGKRSPHPSPEVEVDNEPMTKAFRRDLVKQLRKIKDPRRYLVASQMKDLCVFYYCADTHTFVVRDYQRATAFKSKKIAKAVKKALGKKYIVVVVTRSKSGRLRLAERKKTAKKAQ